MARRERFLFFLLVVGASAGCLPEELELPPGGGGNVGTSEGGGTGGSSVDDAQGGGGIDAPSMVPRDANIASDRSATEVDAARDVRARDATDAATARDAASDRPVPPRDAPTLSTDARADVTAERSTEGSTGRDASDACVRTCPTTPIALNAQCADGCGGTCECELNLSCTTTIGGIALCLMP